MDAETAVRIAEALEAIYSAIWACACALMTATIAALVRWAGK